MPVVQVGKPVGVAARDPCNCRLIARVGRASFGGPGHPEASPGGAVTLRWPKPHTSPGLGPSHGVGRPLVRAWAAGAMSVPRVRLQMGDGGPDPEDAWNRGQGMLADYKGE